MKPARAPILVFFLLLLPSLSHASVALTNLRMWQAPDHTRLVFDVSAPLQHRLFALENPDRIVIDMENAVLSGTLPARDYDGPFLRSVRSGRPDAKTLRIVLDLKRAVRPRTFVLKPNKVYGHRLVIDLYDQAARTAPVATRRSRPDDSLLVVAIDPGHGGEDFGASGRRGTREKNVVLAISRDLREIINRTPGMRAVLTRDGDYYVSLYGRIARARQKNADLFISIHADAFRDRSVRGSSVYTLSQRGASSAQAKILADKENAADLFGGVSIADKDDLLAKVLLDLSMTQTISDSLEFGGDVLRALKRSGRVHIPRVEQAGFAVLKSADVPSILVETAFISNPDEERMLRSRKHQRRIARAIFGGVERYAAKGKIKPITVASNPPRRHVVRRGDTLSEIAERYNVSLRALRKANNIRGSVVRIGQVLRIPSMGAGA